MSASTSIGVALVGTGFGQKVHLPGLEAHPRIRVVAVYHRDRQKAQAIAQTHHIPHACTTIEEVVALPEVQAVSISTPPFLHYDMAKAVLQSGKHLFLEKPTTLTATEARELYYLAQQTGSIVTMDFEFRSIPSWLYLAELLAAGYVGQPRLIKIDWLGAGRANPDRPWSWYSVKAQGGGVLGSLGSHAFDYIDWLFGSVTRLSARLSTTITTRPDPQTHEPRPVDADDTCTATLELQNGALLQLCLSAVTYQGRGHWVEVYGDRGTLVLGNENQQDYIHGFKLWGSQSGQALAELKVPERLEFARTFPDGRIAPFMGMVDRWVQSIDQKAAIVPSLREGVYSQLLMDLCHQSHLSGSWVSVPSLEQFLKA